jgi:hypothetical protein
MERDHLRLAKDALDQEQPNIQFESLRKILWYKFLIVTKTAPTISPCGRRQFLHYVLCGCRNSYISCMGRHGPESKKQE